MNQPESTANWRPLGAAALERRARHLRWLSLLPLVCVIAVVVVGASVGARFAILCLIPVPFLLLLGGSGYGLAGDLCNASADSPFPLLPLSATSARKAAGSNLVDDTTLNTLTELCASIIDGNANAGDASAVRQRLAQTEQEGGLRQRDAETLIRLLHARCALGTEA